ncbi:protein kinase domain-containing protein [Streptomyces sp. NPDC002577]
MLPATIGPYVVMRQLGEGGMGVVSLCRTPSGRLVAVKQVREEYADDPAFRSRFRREVAAARRVSGVYTVPVVDADTDGYRPWVATAYIPAPTLDQAVRTCGSFQESALRALGTGLAEALGAIHAAGLVHRDLKPGNVLLAADGPRVIDFGITKALGETRLTGTGTVIGSPAFMAPEQVASFHDVGPECDIFALAGMLVYAACGEGPFGLGDEGVLHRVVTAEPDLHGVPAALHPLLLRCLDKTPSRRPTLEQILAELAPADPEALLVPALREDLAARAREAELMAVVPPPPGTLPGDGGKGPRPSRRAVLIGGLSVLGALAAGGVVTAVLADDGDSGGTDGKSQGSGKPLGSTVRTVKLTDPPKPLWTTPVPISVASPQLYPFGSTLVLHDGQYAAAAFDASSGDVRWRHGLGADGQVVREKDPLAQAFVLGRTSTGLLASDMSTGLSSSEGKYSLETVHLLETVHPATARVRSKIRMSEDADVSMLLASYGKTAYCQVRKIEGGFSFTSPTPSATPGYSVSETAAAIDLDDGSIRWQKPVVATSLGIRFAADRHGFYYTEDTDAGLTLHALDAARGTSRWSQKVPAHPDSNLPAYMQSAGGELTSSLTAAGDLLITVNVKGGMTAYDAASGTRRWSVSMTAATPPAVAGDLVLANDGGRVYAVDLHTGKVRWKIASPQMLSTYSFSIRTIAASEQVTAVLFSPFQVSASSTSVTGGKAGCLVLRTSDGKQLWALQEKPSSSAAAAPSASPSPSGIGSGLTGGIDSWGVAVQDSTVFVSGGGRVRAYRADAE